MEHANIDSPSNTKITSSLGKEDPSSTDKRVDAVDIVKLGQNIIDAHPLHALDLLVSLEFCGRLAFLVSRQYFSPIFSAKLI